MNEKVMREAARLVANGTYNTVETITRNGQTFRVLSNGNRSQYISLNAADVAALVDYLRMKADHNRLNALRELARELTNVADESNARAFRCDYMADQLAD